MSTSRGRFNGHSYRRGNLEKPAPTDKPAPTSVGGLSFKTEREGFEPSDGSYESINRLAICRFRPLSHLSRVVKHYGSRS